MKLLFASDSFKGSLSSGQTAVMLTRAAEEVFGQAECVCLPVADGGEGTVDAVIAAVQGEKRYKEVHGPLMDPVNAYYGKTDDRCAILEMAQASGLTLISEDRRNPLYTSSFGTGELIRDALDRGFRQISIAIGGSATNDGGMGCARALGVRFLAEDGRELEGRGIDLEKVYSIDMSGLDPRLKSSGITVMCDVTNPLCGENGATRTFGAQKGGTPPVLDRLEKGMRNYRDVIRRQFAIDPDAIPGAGAAGGLGTALTVFLGGRMKSGVNAVLDLIDFDRRLEGVDLVVTGEGRTDWQSCFGKVMQGIGERAGAKGIPVVGLCGSLGKGADQIFDHGICSLMTAVDAPMSLEEAIDRAEELYYSAAVRMFRLIQTGMKLGHRL